MCVYIYIYNGVYKPTWLGSPTLLCSLISNGNNIDHPRLRESGWKRTAGHCTYPVADVPRSDGSKCQTHFPYSGWWFGTFLLSLLYWVGIPPARIWVISFVFHPVFDVKQILAVFKGQLGWWTNWGENWCCSWENSWVFFAELRGEQNDLESAWLASIWLAKSLLMLDLVDVHGSSISMLICWRTSSILYHLVSSCIKKGCFFWSESIWLVV